MLLQLAITEPVSGWQIAGPIALVIGVSLIIFRRPLGEFLPMSRSDRVNHALAAMSGLGFTAFGAYALVAGLFGD